MFKTLDERKMKGTRKYSKETFECYNIKNLIFREFEDTKFQICDIKDTAIFETSFINCVFDTVVLQHVKFENCDFSGSELFDCFIDESVTFVNCKFTKVFFRSCEIRSKFINCDLDHTYKLESDVFSEKPNISPKSSNLFEK